MFALSWLLLMTIASGGGDAPSQAGWENIFPGEARRAVNLIEATGRDNWVAGGPGGLVTARGGHVSIESTHDHGVLGFYRESPGSLYALGEGELIWHFDGTAWIEEHIAPLPPRGRRPFAEHMLYLAYHEPSAPAGPLVAIGLKLMLIKRPDGTWTPPAAIDQDGLHDIGLRGPRIAMPGHCDRAGWRWLGSNRGAFYCHDRRMFLWDAGTVTPRGTMPRACFEALGALIQVKGALYASCDSPSLWRTEGQAWHRIALPEEKGLKGPPALSYAEGCLFAAGDRTVWRTCRQ